MRMIVMVGLVWVWPSLLWAAPAQKLAEAKAEISQDHLYAADALLHEVVQDPNAAVAEVEEALFIQSMIYAGDVLGAHIFARQLALGTTEGSPLKTEIARQLLSARMAFSVVINDYLNATVMGSELQSIKLQLPSMTDDDVAIMMATLDDADALVKINTQFAEDPTAGRGLLARINQYSFALAIKDAVPAEFGQKLSAVQQGLAGGVSFNRLCYLDWAARVALDMHRMVNEPGGPDLLGLAQRCDKRITDAAAADPNSQYVKNAQQRMKQYTVTE